MNYYETIYIIHPALESGRLKDIILSTQSMFEGANIEVLSTNLWGKKKLAYLIDKQQYGTYVLVQLKSSGEDINKISTELEHNPDILAYLTSKISESDINTDVRTLDEQILGSKSSEPEAPKSYKSTERPSEPEAAEAEADEEENEDEDPVGEPEAEAEGKPEEEPEDHAGEGDTKPTGPDPILVSQVARIVKQQLEDEQEEDAQAEQDGASGPDAALVAQVKQMLKDKPEVAAIVKQDMQAQGPQPKGQIKLSGKKEKINTSPKMEHEIRKGRMSFKEAIRMSVTGTNLIEGYESTVLEVLQDEGKDGPLGYEPFFEKGKLFVEKGSERAAKKALQQSKDINKLPKIIGEELDPEEYLSMEAVEVDGRYKGFKEALKRLTYEKLKQLKDEAQIPEGLNKEEAASFMAAASAAKREGKKKFKFGDKEYPVTIKVDIPLKGEK